MPESTTPAQAPLLEIRGISKTFPGVRALDNVSLRLEAGEVLALVGENGAGKSTLIKILGGAHRANAGELFMQGKQVSIDSPSLAQTMGVSIIYQEFNLIPDLNVRENIYLGRERKKVWFLDEKREAVGVRKLFERLGLRLDP
ncbi:MAG: ATP-binding cassette domain-containing protein, partial [Opitutae bacterium]|nr:ATP-binding cassette domain-containing protein [Opitutae bacterium]